MGRIANTTYGENDFTIYFDCENYMMYDFPESWSERGDDYTMPQSQKLIVACDGWDALDACEFDEIATWAEFNYYVGIIRDDFISKFSSFVPLERWNDSFTADTVDACIKKNWFPLAENGLYYLAVSENDTCVSVSLIAKDSDITGLQKKDIGAYSRGLCAVLLDLFGEYYSGSGWVLAHNMKDGVCA